jgi:probable HAF family extracellular repeat protein
MTTRKTALAVMFTALITTALTIAGNSAATATPKAVVLDTLPGTSRTWAWDINNAGFVVGESTTADFGQQAVRWNPAGQITVLAGDGSSANMITDTGFAIGGTFDDSGVNHRAFLWNPVGRVTALHYLPGGSNAWARDVTDRGAVVGDATDSDGVGHAVRWNPWGRVAKLAALPGEISSTAVAINEHGTVTGQVELVVADTQVTHMVRWEETGGVTDLGAALSRPDSSAGAINNAGTIIGTVADSAHGSRIAASWDRWGRVTEFGQPPAAFQVWPKDLNERGMATGYAVGDYSGAQFRAIRWDRRGRAVDLGVLPGRPSSQAHAINKLGVVAGTSQIEGSPHPGSLRYSNAVTWDQDGRITDLGALVGQWSAAFSINDGGTVCGTKANADGTEMRAVVWSVG